MSFRTRKRGTPKQIGKKFPVQEKKKLPPKITFASGYTEKIGPDALRWLKANKNKTPFAGNAFGSKEDAIDFVKKLKKAGAVSVRVSGIIAEPWRMEKEGGPIADILYVHVPRGRYEFVKRFTGAADEFEEVKPGLFRMWWD